ncbi:hypothetical protein [Aquibium oceanicum]|uniref:Uncharacterized protein n=1 Tax=Aquibium oceanicum TaxID=1670800 RepID=A0A1L3SL17_9HYPH|nr:hypothetical protein [Aquibium oceanicum]APH70099.1 hypothetical protein BSQ44_00910 [Aquibium oceanicum]
MKTILVLAASFGLSMSSAYACSVHKTAHSGQMTVASVQSDAVAVDREASTASISAQPVEKPAADDATEE